MRADKAAVIGLGDILSIALPPLTEWAVDLHERVAAESLTAEDARQEISHMIRTIQDQKKID